MRHWGQTPLAHLKWHSGRASLRDAPPL